jgi:hypothetical protein
MHDIPDGHDGHSHAHVHTRQDALPKAPDDAGKIKLVLGFTLEHNRQHAAEMRVLAENLRMADNADAADLLLEGIDDYERGNEKVARALRFVNSMGGK